MPCIGTGIQNGPRLAKQDRTRRLRSSGERRRSWDIIVGNAVDEKSPEWMRASIIIFRATYGGGSYEGWLYAGTMDGTILKFTTSRKLHYFCAYDCRGRG
jgi:hypothetical protein